MADEYTAESEDELRLGGTEVLKPDRDWRDYIPKFEHQYLNGVESMSCVTYGSLAAIETLLEDQFGLEDEDFSDRFTSKLAGTTRTGNNPHKVAETIRKYGVIPEEYWPFDKSITTWEKYFASIPSDLKVFGRSWLKKWKFGHEWVITPSTDFEDKPDLLWDALQYSPVGVSVFGWAHEDGVYYKNGLRDNHWCLLVYMDKNYYYVLDTYEPFIKRLDRKYDFGFAKRYSLSRKESVNWFQRFINWLFS